MWSSEAFSVIFGAYIREDVRILDGIVRNFGKEALEQRALQSRSYSGKFMVYLSSLDNLQLNKFQRFVTISVLNYTL